MLPVRHFVFVALGALALAGCSQVEEITIDPIYNKYGSASCAGDLYLETNTQGQLNCVQQCRGGNTPSVTAANVRACVPTNCPPGTQAAAGTSFNGVRCVQIPRDDPDQPQDPQRPTAFN